MGKHRVTRRIRGLEDRHILDEHKQLRDVRSIWIQILDPLKLRPIAFSLMGGYIIFPFIMPNLTNITFLMGLIHFTYFYSQWKDERLPMRLPVSANKTDYSDPVPGRKKYFNSSGIMYYGNELKTNKELWTNYRDALTHTLIFGTTGSGKTEILHGLSFSALASCGGYYYIDPKASPKLPMQVYTMCRLCGRDDDFRVLNYQSDSKQSHTKNIIRTSNTNNPFAFGSAEALTQLLVSLIPKSSGDNAIFSQNAQTLITALMFGLVELRDKHGYDLNINTIRTHMTLTEYVKLALRKDISKATRDAMHSFLSSVGWRSDKGTEEDPLAGQPRSFPEQFGYARSYFGLSLASLTDTYGNIYNTEYGEVDMYDVIISRRICVTLLPSLAKSPQELENLGKISLSALRNACAVGLGGGKIEGTVEEVLEALPTDSNTLFLSVTDEYEAIPTPGYSEIFTQGRSLGIAGVCATQSYGGLKGADEKGAQQIVENTKVKIVSTVESGEGTWELVDKLSGGEAKVLQSDGFHIPQAHGQQEQKMQFSYRDQGHAKVSGMKRIALRDLQNQIEGEFHLFFRGAIIRGDSFYTDIPLTSNRQLRIPHMLKINPIDKEKYLRIIDIATQFKKLVLDPPSVQCNSIDYKQIIQFVSDQTISEDQCIATMLNVDIEPKHIQQEKIKKDSGLEERAPLDIDQLDCNSKNLAPLAIDDTGKAISDAHLTEWMGVHLAADIVEIEKETGYSQEDAIAATSQLIVDTSNNAITHPPDPPLPNRSKHNEVKKHLSKLLSSTYQQ